MICERASFAKITRPRLSAVIPRARLYARLDRCRDRAVTWVWGPAGCGKTTLVADYLHRRRLRSLWYQLDEGDADAATFFYYLGLAAKRAAPGRRRPLPLFTPEYQAGLPAFTSRYFEDLFRRLGVPSAIVLDDYQRVPAGSPFHETVHPALSVVPAGGRVIVISRAGPPIGLARVHARERMASLGWDELRFSLAEATEMVRSRIPELRSRKAIRRLHAIADGWIAGLVLILEAVKRGAEPRSLETAAPDAILDYLGAEVFARLDGRTRDFLLKSALLPRMTAKMAQDITGVAGASRILRELARRHGFVENHASSEPIYQYHPLFRSFLLSRGEDRFSSTTARELGYRCASALEASGQVEDAAALWWKHGRWDSLAGLITKHAASLVAQGRQKTLEGWLARVPEPLQAGNPWLLYWKGVCRLACGPSEARSCFERALALFESVRDAAGTYLAWSGIVDSIHFEWDDFTRLDAPLDWLDRRLREDPSFPSPEIEARVASSLSGALLWRGQPRPDVGAWLERACALSRAHADTSARLQTLLHAVVYHMWTGAFAQQGALVAEARRLADSPRASPLTRVMWKYEEAAICEWASTPAGSPLRSVCEGLEIARRHGVHVLDYMLLAQGVYGALTLGDLERAEEFLARMSAVVDQRRRHTVGHFRFISGWYHLVKGDLGRARADAERALELIAQAGTPFPEAFCRQLLAKVVHRMGDRDRAAELLAAAVQIVRMRGWRYAECVLRLTEAHLALERGDEGASVGPLREGMRLGHEMQLRSLYFIWEPAVLARLCGRALDDGIEVDYAQDLIRALRLVPDATTSPGEQWPWPLKIHTLGRFGVLRDGKPIQCSRKAQGRPLSMLKVVIALGGREVPEGVPADVLWPEADGDAAHHSLEMTLHRLRALLGHPEAVQLRDGRLSLDPRFCWVDVWAFERLIGRSDQARTEGRMDLAVGLAREALRVYRGAFLAGEADRPDWVRLRERVRSMFLRTVGWLGQASEDRGDWNDALECYRRALEVDDLAEDLYRRLMLCHRRLGQIGEGLSAYDRCRRVLGAVGLEPSAETVAVRQALA